MSEKASLQDNRKQEKQPLSSGDNEDSGPLHAPDMAAAIASGTQRKRPLTPSHILQLQRIIGNQAVMRLVGSSTQSTSVSLRWTGTHHPVQREDDDDDNPGENDNNNENNNLQVNENDSESEAVNEDNDEQMPDDVRSGMEEDVSENEVGEGEENQVIAEGEDEIDEAEPDPNQQRIARIDAEIARLKLASKMMVNQHENLFLPLFLIDQLSMMDLYWKKLRGKKLNIKQKTMMKSNIGRTGLVALTGGVNVHGKVTGKGMMLKGGPKWGHFRPFNLGNAPWNVFLWISRILRYRIKVLEKKKRRLDRRRI